MLTWRKWWTPNNASKWQMGFNSAFKGLMQWYSIGRSGCNGSSFYLHHLSAEACLFLLHLTSLISEIPKCISMTFGFAMFALLGRCAA